MNIKHFITVSVAALTLLACQSNTNENMSTLHLTKEWDKTYHKEYIAAKCPEYLEENEKKYHQYSAKIFAKENLRITDEDILDAIGNHVNGTSEKLLSRIVFCSDKIDDSRGFDNTEIKALCFEDLPKAYEEIKERQRQHLLKKGIVHE